MRRTNILRCGYAVAVVGCLTATTVSAQPADKRTYFTFSTPVAVPGVSLAPGKYIFRIVDPDSGGKVVQVLNADGTKPYAMFFSIPVERPTPAPQPEVRFMETAEGVPPAIKAWWYPGETTGREFIYPKEQARRLAQGTKKPVLTTKQQTTTVEQTNTADLCRISSTGEESAVNTASKPTASAPEGKPQQGEEAPASISIKPATVPAPPSGSPRGL